MDNSGGGGWIRTNVGASQQIYSLPPLATRALHQMELSIITNLQSFVKASCLIFLKKFCFCVI